MTPEPQPTPLDPTPAIRARAAWTRIADRARTQPLTTGRDLTPTLVQEEIERELEEQTARLVAAHQITLASLELEADELKSQLSRTRAALREALTKATQVGPVTGSVAAWEKRLASMPPLARHEIASWRSAALRRLSVIGTTQSDVMIVRLADVSLEPYTSVEIDAPTS